MRNYNYKKAILFSIVLLAILSIYSSASASAACDSCISSCQGLSSCCTGTGCICEDECSGGGGCGPGYTPHCALSPYGECWWGCVCTAATPSTPTPLNPADNLTDVSINPTLDWSDVSNATSYTARVCNNSSCSSVTKTSSPVSASQWQVSPALNTGTTYWWQVKATKYCQDGSWSTARKFTTACSSSPPGSPSLLSPARSSTGVLINTTLDWDDVGCASTYDVRICTNSACSSVVASSNVPVSQWQISPVLNVSTTYYWQVRAKNSYGDGSWSVAYQFTTSSDIPLLNGIPLNASITGILSGSVWNYYYVDIPSRATNFIVDLYNLSKDADLYVKMSSKPSSSSYNCRSWQNGTTSEKCSVPSSSLYSRWWIGINNYDTGTITYTVEANWSVPACASVSLSPGSDEFAATSALGVVTVTTPSSSICSWTAASNDSWITITSGSSGSGNGTVGYSVAANNGFARTGTITIGGQTFTLTQASARAYLDDVQKAYIAFYGRPADPGGLAYWVNQANGAGSMVAVLNAFGNAPEATILYPGSMNTVDRVNKIYLQVFDRPAEPAGQTYWADLIDHGTQPDGTFSGKVSAAQAAWTIMNGAQNSDADAVANKLTAANLFTRTIDPDLDGSNFQATYAGDGDVIAGRNFLTLYATAVKVPTQAETTLFIKNNIANPGDPILG